MLNFFFFFFFHSFLVKCGSCDSVLVVEISQSLGFLEELEDENN